MCILFLFFCFFLASTTTSAQLLTQPVSFIVLYRSDGTGNVTRDRLFQQVNQLNRAFSGLEARNAKYPKWRDAKIQFVLHGIQYVENDRYFELCALPSVIREYRPKYQMDPRINLNIYVCWCKYMLGSAFLPYDYFLGDPITEGHFAKGIIIHHELLPGGPSKLYTQGDIGTHEVGHFYGLKHPYQDGCSSRPGTGDGIADTPQLKYNPLTFCSKVKPKALCAKRKVNRFDYANYMLATDDKCRNHFTIGQVNFMQDTINRYMPTLLNAQTNATQLWQCVSNTTMEPCTNPFGKNGGLCRNGRTDRARCGI